MRVGKKNSCNNYAALAFFLLTVLLLAFLAGFLFATLRFVLRLAAVFLTADLRVFLAAVLRFLRFTAGFAFFIARRAMINLLISNKSTN